MQDLKISAFFNATSPVPIAEVSVAAVIKGIREGKWSEQVQNLRGLSEEEYKEQKKNLPAITFSGTFSERKIDKLLTYSSLVVLDIDNIGDEEAFGLKMDIMKDEHYACCFVSPSGKGVKVVYKVDTDKDNHLAAFQHLQDYFQKKYLVKVDDSGKDLSRLCFVSYDPELIYNEEAKTFVVDRAYGHVKLYTPNDKFTNFTPEKDYTKIFQLCEKWVSGGNTPITYVQGSRNRYIHALSCALNRVGMPIADAVKLLQQSYDLEAKEIQQCARNAYFKHQPEHGSVQVKDITIGTYKAPAYVLNYTDNVVEADLMAKTAMLFSKGVSMGEIGDIISCRAKYFNSQGLIDVNRASLGELMNRAIKMLNEKVAEQSGELSLKYENSEDIGYKLINQDFVKGLVPTYIGDMDEALGGGLRAKSFYGLIGLGGTFKSIILQYIAYANATNGIPVLYLNGEMSMDQFYDRLASMVFGINFHHEVTSGRLTKENVGEFIEKMKADLGNNLFVVNGNGFNEENVIATLNNIKATTGKTIRFIGADGISQFDSKGKEEIPAAIFNTGVCKEIAKNCNDGEGAVVIGLMHTSGDQNYLFRDTGLKCRGGIKTIANMDGYAAVSLLLDPETNSLENDDDAIYLPGKVYLRFKDKRTRTGIVNRIVNINDKTLHLTTENCDVQDYETKINIKRK